MELVRERETLLTAAELEAQKHNAQIKERYRMLQNAEADQFASKTYTEPVRASVIAPEAPAFVAGVEETATLQQTPEVVDFVRERVTAPIFTAEKFDRMQNVEQNVAAATISVAAPVVQEMPLTVTAVNVEPQERYGITPLAKAMMGVFAVVACGMMALIGVNSNIIEQKKLKLKNLEEKREQLVEQHEEIQSRIEAAQSEETIRAWAESQGYVLAGE